VAESSSFEEDDLKTQFALIAGLVLLAALASAPIASADDTEPPARVLAPCNDPNGWNSTDAHRELAGIPNGYHHQCLVQYQDGRRRWDQGPTRHWPM
jgi:hypothetical protein